MANSSAPDILFNATLDQIHYAILAKGSQRWRLAALREDWHDELHSLPWEDRQPHNTDQIWLAPVATSMQQPTLIAMCCGLGAFWPGMGRELYANFPLAAQAMDEIASIADWDVLGLLDETSLEKIGQTRWQIPYLFMLEYAQWSQVHALGMRPQVICGHSLGELIALCFAGVYSLRSAWHLLEIRAEHMALLEDDRAREGGMLAVPADYREIAEILRQWPQLRISNRNTTGQYVLGGPRDQLLEARRQLRRNHIPAIMLNMGLAFHNPAMRILRSLSKRRLAGLPMHAAAVTMLSCVDGQPYPAARAEICERIADLDENTVDWVNLVEMICREWPNRYFVEFGPQETLCGITGELAPDSDCLAVDKKNHEALAMRIACCRLFAAGFTDPAAIASHVASPQPAGAAYVPAEVEASGSEDDLADIEEADLKTIFELIGEASHIPAAEIRPDMDLRHDLAVRSSHFPFLMLEAEHKLGRPVVLENLFQIITVADLVRFLTGHVKTKSSAGGAAAVRPLFVTHRQPLQRLALDDSGLASGNRAFDLAASGILADDDSLLLLKSENDEVPESMFQKCFNPGCSVRYWQPGPLAPQLAGIGGLILIPPAKDSKSNPEKDYASGDGGIVNRLPAGGWVCILQQFKDCGANWAEIVLAWAQKNEAIFLGRPLCLIAILQDKIYASQLQEIADLLTLELRYGQDMLTIWRPSRKSFSRFCRTSSIYHEIAPLAAAPGQANSCVFWGAGQYSLYAKPPLASHGADAKFSPLTQNPAPQPFTDAAWLPVGQIVQNMLEASQIALPWLQPMGLMDFRLSRIPALPQGIAREYEIGVDSRLTMFWEDVGARICPTQMRIAEIAANGRKTGHWLPMARGRCSMSFQAAQTPPLWEATDAPGAHTSQSYLPMLYDVLGLGPDWQPLQSLAGQPDKNGLFIAGVAHMQPVNMDEQADSHFNFLCCIMDASLLICRASMAACAETEAAISAKLASWRFSGMGLMRFDLSLFPVLPRKIAMQWRVSWHDDRLLRFDLQALWEHKAWLTINNLEFEHVAVA